MTWIRTHSVFIVIPAILFACDRQEIARHGTEQNRQRLHPNILICQSPSITYREAPRIIEIAFDGAERWSYSPSPETWFQSASRLKNGNTLVAHGSTITILDKNGKILQEKNCDPWCVRDVIELEDCTYILVATQRSGESALIAMDAKFSIVREAGIPMAAHRICGMADGTFLLSLSQHNKPGQVVIVSHKGETVWQSQDYGQYPTAVPFGDNELIIIHHEERQVKRVNLDGSVVWSFAPDDTPLSVDSVFPDLVFVAVHSKIIVLDGGGKPLKTISVKAYPQKLSLVYP